LTDLTPHFEDVQSHYDLSDNFYRLFLDPTQTYSCAYFERDDMTLEQAQFAKMDLSLGKLGLRPGMTLLDIGCGWGATMIRAVERYDVNVIGLTLSENQHAHVTRVFAESDTTRSKRVLLKGWEQFDEPVDRIVSIGAFEHFGFDRYPDFFKMAYRVLPDDGVMMLHTICGMSMEYARANGVPLTMELIRFVKFLMTDIFPGGQLCKTEMVGELACSAGFTLAQTQSLQPHYARTLDIWADLLSARRDEAIALQSEEVYDRYMHYLIGCAQLFKQRQAEVNQFTLVKSPGKLESTAG
jgi:cyclopropane-fatty-acyl-phospholipid synthase